MFKKKILFILFFLCSCSTIFKNNDKERLCLDLEYVDFKQLSKDRITKHLRHSFDIFSKEGKDGLYIVPQAENVPNQNQLPLIKEKFLMLDIKEKKRDYSYIKKGKNPSYDALIAGLYDKAYVTILISPKGMKVWRLWLYPIGVVGYQIEEIQEIEVNENQREWLEYFRSPENLKYWR